MVAWTGTRAHLRRQGRAGEVKAKTEKSVSEGVAAGGRRHRAGRTRRRGPGGVAQRAGRPPPRAPLIVVALVLVPVLWAGSACGSPPPVAQAPAPAAGGAPSAPLSAPTGRTTPLERPSRADEPNTTHGIYTEAQAARGLKAFEEICSECHETGDWTDPAFLERWEEASVYRLWYWIYERMPHGRPGTLSRQQVTDALTYILQLNGLPPGQTELATDDDTIDDYWIIWKVQ